MKRCPITYELIPSDQDYSTKGLKLLSPKLTDLKPLGHNAEELRNEAVTRVGKMSIQGVQAKLSAQLEIKQQRFRLVDQYGHYILKPQSEFYPELPENEAITMTLAASIGIEVPVHGLVYSEDRNLTYFIKRFDRVSHKDRLPLEDFGQLSGKSRDTKYRSSMEQIVKIIMEYCTFPKIELAKFFKLTLFNFLIGNEDMHIKNFSLITRGEIIGLSPAYDLVNSSIALITPENEIALPINGKKSNLTKRDFTEYFAFEKMGLNQTTVESIIEDLRKHIPRWQALIGNSFLSSKQQQHYLSLLNKRSERIL